MANLAIEPPVPTGDEVALVFEFCAETERKNTSRPRYTTSLL